MPPTRREAYLLGCEHLAAAGTPAPRLEAELLLRSVLHVDRTALYTRWDQGVPGAEWTRYRQLLDARASGHPVHYLIGEREFMGLPFYVDPRVMIPRPETEVLVESILACFRGHPHPTFVDVGTGSGCIGISLAAQVPSSRVIATDVSHDALAVAYRNAARHRVQSQMTFLEGDLLQPIPMELVHHVDAIASNPPYIAASRAASLPAEIRDHEPSVALFAPGEGTDIHAQLIREAPRWLTPAGLLAMEVGLGQAERVASSMRQNGHYASIRTVKDLAGVDRVVIGVLGEAEGGSPARRNEKRR